MTASLHQTGTSLPDGGGALHMPPHPSALEPRTYPHVMLNCAKEVWAMRTSDVLRRRGIEMSEEKFATLLDEALSASPSAPAPAGDPREVLTDAESVVLTIGGADLAALGEDEGWPGTDAAASFGALLAGSLTVAAVAARLGLDASRIRHRLIEGTLYGVRLRSGWRLPAFQFDRRGALVAGVEGVLAASREICTPSPSSVGSPRPTSTWSSTTWPCRRSAGSPLGATRRRRLPSPPTSRPDPDHCHPRSMPKFPPPPPPLVLASATPAEMVALDPGDGPVAAL